MSKRDLPASLAGRSRRQRRAATRAAKRAARRALPAISAGAALALGLGLQPSEARANTFEVTNLNDSGAGSLRQAIDDANNDPDADVITFQAGLTGTITLTSGELGLYESVEIQGPGADKLTIDANHASRVFYLYNQVATPVDVTISGLKITGGSSNRGAGVIDWSEHLTLDSVEISGNATTSGRGGGVSVNQVGAVLTVRNSIISGNTATVGGGGIYVGHVDGAVLIQNTKITGNQATQVGGGVYLYGTVDLVTIERSTISGNTTSGLGGGIYAFPFYADNGPVVIRQSLITDNHANAGGGVFFDYPDQPVTIQNCTISGNEARAGRGGGVYLYALGSSATFTLDHTTVAGNAARTVGGGLDVQAAALTLLNSIVADNTVTLTPGPDDVNTDTGSIAAGYSLIETPGTAAITGGNNIFAVDPALGALGDNGGPTQTQLPAPASVVINAGNPAYAGPPDEDQRGSARVVGAATDMGAVEFNAGTLQCSASAASVSEAAATIALSVTRTGGSDGAASVDIITADGTATQPADYTMSMATLQWSNQDAATKTLNVPIIDENLAESSEIFSAALSNASGAPLGATTSVTVTVSDDDAKPTITAIADQSIDEDAATAAIPFTIDDADDLESALTLSATSSNHDLADDADVVLGGSDASRTVKITPKAGASGTTDVTITVGDGTNTNIATFSVEVSAVDDAPTISAIDDQTIDENEATDALDFTIGDPDTDIADVKVTAKSSKHTLLADGGVTLGGSGTSRTVKIKPLADKSGEVDVIISVSDGTNITVTTFTVTVKAVNTDPDHEPDAGTGMMEPADVGEPADASSGGSGGASSGGSGGASSGGHDASTGAGVPIGEPDASKGEPSSDSGSDEAAADGGESGAGMQKKSDDGCGCSTVGAAKHPSGVVVSALLGLFGFAVRRRRRNVPGCPRCS